MRSARPVLTVTALLLCGVSALAQRERPQPSVVTPEAKAALIRMTAAYGKLRSVRLVVTWKETVVPAEPGRRPDSKRFMLSVLRPNLMNGRMTFQPARGKATGASIVSDGRTLWYWQSNGNLVRREKAPAALDTIPSVMNLPDLDLMTANGDPFRWVHRGAKVTLDKPRTVRGVPVDVIVARRAKREDEPYTATFTLLVGRKDHLLRGMVSRYEGKDPQTGKAGSYTNEVIYEKVEANPKLRRADFRFARPKGAKLEASRL